MNTEYEKEGIKSSYTARQESEDKLILSERLAFTGRIAASIAHEIRNPLTNVIMSIQQLKKAINIGNPKVKHIDIIERNTERIKYLIAELLNCARPPKLNICPYDIHLLLKNILESTNVKIRLQKIKVFKTFTSKPSTISMDKEHMERALSNIVTNAIEAMPKGGILTIITELKGDCFMIKVQDSGRGIPEKDIIRIFDPFFSSKPKGVGLGLTVCYGIIVSHGGTIEVESKLRKGSIFMVSLPVEQREF
jgi:signal transduction histidine kinase